MTDLSTLPPTYTQVLEALRLPDPAQRRHVDTVVHAVGRRLPGVPEEEIATALRRLQALGLVALPYLDAAVNPRATANTASWITPEGLEALRARKAKET